MVRSAEFGEIVEGGLAIPNDSGAGIQHGAHPVDVPGLFAFATIFRMGDRNQVMDEIDRPDVFVASPSRESRIVEASVPDVEIKAVFSPKLSPGGGSQDALDEPAPSSGSRLA